MHVKEISSDLLLRIYKFLRPVLFTSVFIASFDVNCFTLNLSFLILCRNFKSKRKNSAFKLPYKARGKVGNCKQQQYAAFKAIEI